MRDSAMRELMRVSGRAQKLLGAAALLSACGFGVGFWYCQNRPSVVYEQAIAEAEKGDLRRVNDAASRLERYPEFQRHAHLLRGCVLLDAGKSASALKEFSATRPEGVLRFPVLQFTAQALYRTGRLSEAADLLIMLAKEDGSNAEAHRWLGAIYYDIGSPSEAVLELTEAAELRPLDHRPHRLLGLICTDESLFGLAIEHYRTALKLGKDIPQPDIQADLAIVLIQRNRFPEALEVLAATEPTATVWALRADCYDGLGKPDEARDAVEKSLLSDPDNPKALRLYGAQQVADGNAQDAIVPLQKVLQQDPHDTKARYQLAMAYLKLGQTEAGQREMDARDASTKLHEQFYAAAKQASTEPANVEIREQLAAIAASLGKREVAKRWQLAANACRGTGGANQAPQKSPM